VKPTVTGLRERRRGRVAVELDDRPWRVLPTVAVARAGLTVGRRLDRATARELARELRRARALAAATRSLAAGDRSQKALEQQLARAGHAPGAREEAVAALDRAGLVDDARVAESRAVLLARRGYGDTGIRADLQRRLISAEVAASAVAGLEPEVERLQRLLEGQTVTPRLLRRLAGRGFSRDALDDVVSAVARRA
jgi:SOS response regulatory protein OraA/RecX